MKIGLFIFLGGGIGSLLRYATTKYVSGVYEGNFPLATFLINAIGCLLIGCFSGFLLKNMPEDTAWKSLLITGFCGGFTTFSAFSLENITLIAKNENEMMLIYVGLSVVMGFFCTYLGLRIAAL